MAVTDPITALNNSGSEAISDWTGLTMRDTDGYNRFGWIFGDGYWGLSTVYNAGSDYVPDRAIAYVGAGDSYGDLSSIENGDSGADKIGATTISGVSGNDVQTILENIISGNADISGTPNNNFTINNDSSAAVDEDACLIMSGGDGVAVIDGYLCTITDSVNGDRFRFRMYQDGSLIDTDLHLGGRAATDNVDSVLTFNSGNGTDAYQATIRLDGSYGNIEYTAPSGEEHHFIENVHVLDDMKVDGYLTVDGYATLGDTSDDHIIVNGTFYSDLRADDCNYLNGTTTARWNDGYFCFGNRTNYTPVGNTSSLEGHFKGIDAALGSVALQPERGAYEITVGEGTGNELDATRAADQGSTIDVSGLTDAQFRDFIFVYKNGQLLYNDPVSRATPALVTNDVARKTGSLGSLVFDGISVGAIVQIVNMT
jgi:hypothetical protein